MTDNQADVAKKSTKERLKGIVAEDRRKEGGGAECLKRSHYLRFYARFVEKKMF